MDLENLALEQKLAVAIAKTEDTLAEDWLDEEHAKDGVWGAGNRAGIEDLSDGFRSLQDAGAVSGDCTLQVAVDGTDRSYEDTASRLIVFNGLSLIAAEWFEELFFEKDGMYEGLDK